MNHCWIGAHCLGSKWLSVQVIRCSIKTVSTFLHAQSVCRMFGYLILPGMIGTRSHSSEFPMLHSMSIKVPSLQHEEAEPITGRKGEVVRRGC
jgi:hypothetical protein